ncbi:hypothetical protein AK812_SmicGene32988 [Symbiodinium microadriaticum]|uniref:Uncharacterized protein n=1 Tax=Symbiodinium microadriaticum TaxID=2951 RepID=A0A1Q9CST1_SYMMI|nr:hypothetical protein AK812_SmicGene32988 [Symbiodinium microadriaticum]
MATNAATANGFDRRCFQIGRGFRVIGPPLADNVGERYRRLAEDSSQRKERQAAFAAIASAEEKLLEAASGEAVLKAAQESLAAARATEDADAVVDSLRLVAKAYCLQAHFAEDQSSSESERILTTAEHFVEGEASNFHARGLPRGVAMMRLALAEIDLEHGGYIRAASAAELAADARKDLPPDELRPLAMDSVQLQGPQSGARAARSSTASAGWEGNERILFRRLGDRIGEAHATHVLALATALAGTASAYEPERCGQEEVAAEDVKVSLLQTSLRLLGPAKDQASGLKIISQEGCYDLHKDNPQLKGTVTMLRSPREHVLSQFGMCHSRWVKEYRFATHLPGASMLPKSFQEWIWKWTDLAASGWHGDFTPAPDPVTGASMETIIRSHRVRAWGEPPYSIAPGTQLSVSDWPTLDGGGTIWHFTHVPYQCYVPVNLQSHRMTCQKPLQYGQPDIDKALLLKPAACQSGQQAPVALCLLHAKVASKLPSHCNCTDPVSWSSFQGHKENQNSTRSGKREIPADVLSELDSLTALDTLLYKAAWLRFVREAADVEKRFGMRILCNVQLPLVEALRLSAEALAVYKELELWTCHCSVEVSMMRLRLESEKPTEAIQTGEEALALLDGVRCNGMLKLATLSLLGQAHVDSNNPALGAQRIQELLPQMQPRGPRIHALVLDQLVGVLSEYQPQQAYADPWMVFSS